MLSRTKNFLENVLSKFHKPGLFTIIRGADPYRGVNTGTNAAVLKYCDSVRSPRLRFGSAIISGRSNREKAFARPVPSVTCVRLPGCAVKTTLVCHPPSSFFAHP